MTIEKITNEEFMELLGETGCSLCEDRKYIYSVEYVEVDRAAYYVVTYECGHSQVVEYRG